MPATEATHLLTVKDVCARASISRFTLYRMLNAGTFPAPVYLTPRTPRWRSDDLSAWIDALTEGETS